MAQIAISTKWPRNPRAGYIPLQAALREEGNDQDRAIEHLEVGLSAGLLIYSMLYGNAIGVLISAILVASLIGFLIFNKYPAKILPGDSLTYGVGGALVAIMVMGNAEIFGFIIFLPWLI